MINVNAFFHTFRRKAACTQTASTNGNQLCQIDIDMDEVFIRSDKCTPFKSILITATPSNNRNTVLECKKSETVSPLLAVLLLHSP